MTLEAPNLDDRAFQELVDEAKRRVAARCPEWTDHNVSDPGVMLIELFAWMTEQLTWRLNRVPDRLFVKFLDLIGVEPYPPRAAECDVSFWLSAVQPVPVTVPAGTQLATVRSEQEPAVAFTTVEEAAIVPCRLAEAATVTAGGERQDRTAQLRSNTPFLIFATPPVPGDALEVTLSTPVPRCGVTLRFTCDEAYGKGVDPRRPPLIWEAYDGREWKRCDRNDETGGLNRSGVVTVWLPAAGEDGERDAPRHLRCRLRETEGEEQPYDESPRVLGLTAETSAGVARAVHAELVRDELLGSSSGLPGQRFALARGPLVAAESPRIVDTPVGEWRQVRSFATSAEDDRHFVLDFTRGEVVFGPAVREPGRDGLRSFGLAPPAGTPLRLREYRTGGGPSGNVAAQALRVLKSSIPFVSRVENRDAAFGGAAGETLDDAKVRGPLTLHRLERAVTAADYEHLAADAAPEVGRVRCVPAKGEGDVVKPVEVLVMPSALAGPDGRLDPDDLVPSEDLLARVGRYLERRRVVGAHAHVRGIALRGVRVNALVRLKGGVPRSRVEQPAVRALYDYFNPLTGGPNGKGWPFGRPVYTGEVQLVLQRVEGVALVREVKLFTVDLLTGDRGQPVQRIELGPKAQIVSDGHLVAAPEEEEEDG